jgi:hypothetical protein
VFYAFNVCYIIYYNLKLKRCSKVNADYWGGVITKSRIGLGT